MSSIIIIGGGPAGLALAAGLSQVISHDITIIEKTKYDEYVFGEHLQSEILPVLSHLGIPANLLLENSTPCDGICGLWADRPILSKSLFNPYGYDFIIHRPQFEKSLTNYLQKKRDVKFCFGTTAKKIEKGKVSIGNKILPFDYLFDCSGRTSQNIYHKRLIFDKLIGISFFTPAKSDYPTKYYAKVLIESGENGWWYHTRSREAKITTFFTDADIYQSLRDTLQKELDKTSLIKNHCEQLNDHSRVKIAHTSILKSNPTGIVQVGDSFYSLDPLSSQGIYKAFRQVSDITNLFSNENFEEVISEFYEEQKRIFLKHLYWREYHYRKGWLHHKSEFYERRLKLNLLDPSQRENNQ